MKTVAITAVCLAASLLYASCVQAPHSVTLERVGLSPVEPATELAAGFLIVFSAYQAGPPSPTEIDPDVDHHSDYEIRAEGGQLVTKVKNRRGAFGDDPAAVALPPGNYQIVAQANGYGLITLPVTVARGRIVTLHLEGGAMAVAPSNLAAAYRVKLADGRVVGWSTIDFTDP